MDITRHAGQAPLWRNLASRLLNQTAILVGRVVSEFLAVEGTHRYQLAALATLDAFGSVSQAELCRRTNIDRSDMNAVVNALEAEGIVTRVSDPDDRRQNIVEMTKTGKARFGRLKAGIAEAEDHLPVGRHWLQQTGGDCYVCFGYFTTITRFRRLPQKAVAEARIMPAIGVA